MSNFPAQYLRKAMIRAGGFIGLLIALATIPPTHLT